MKVQSLMSRLSLGSQFAASPAKAQTVDELSERIKLAITAAPGLRNVAVRGELQGFKRHSSGHIYFTLLGKDSRISSVLFRSHAESIISWPQDGDEVIVMGSVEVYTKGGAYQLYASRIMPVGLGAQARAKEELRSKLESEGLFDVRHKRAIPEYPNRVVVITSPTGAAFQDILKISSLRAPFVDLVLVPATVQGLDAPPQIAKALALAGTLKGVACVILARGGGAKDDLSPFDDERVVRSVRSCPLPVVAGIGHQTDSSLADLAADISLPTPSAAAERVFPDSKDIQKELSYFLYNLKTNIDGTLQKNSHTIDRLDDGMNYFILKMISEADLFLKDVTAELSYEINMAFKKEESRISTMASMLNALSPLAVLARGYAICRDAQGKIIKSTLNVQTGQNITVQLSDGLIDVAVKNTKEFIIT